LDRRPNGHAHYNLAIELKEQGNRLERHYELALADEPDAHYAIGFELDADGKHERSSSTVASVWPDDINVIRHTSCSDALKIEERLEPAARHCQALQRQPSNVDALAGLAETLLKQERYDDAIQTYRPFIMNPATQMPTPVWELRW
jgi:tetratricopeptide (TPR) repeat protein